MEKLIKIYIVGAIIVVMIMFAFGCSTGESAIQHAGQAISVKVTNKGNTQLIVQGISFVVKGTPQLGIERSLQFIVKDKKATHVLDIYGTPHKLKFK